MLEKTNVLEHLRENGDTVVISDRVLSEEVESDKVWLLERDVFAPQRAAANCIRLILALFIACSEGEHVDEIHGCRPLPEAHDFVPQVRMIILSDPFDVFLEGKIAISICTTDMMK